MKTRWIPLAKANALVEQWHSHLPPVVGHIFAIGAFIDDNTIVGCLIASRPIARHADDGRTLEVIRLCTNGYPNAASRLLSQGRRIAQAFGFERVISSTLEGEAASAYKAIGATVLGTSPAMAWTGGRERANITADRTKVRWRLDRRASVDARDGARDRRSLE